MRGPRFRQTIRLCRNLFSGLDDPKRKQPLAISQLLTIITYLSGCPQNILHVSIMGAVLVGFFGMLRRNEIIGLRWQDIQILEDRVEVTVQYSKTNPKPHVVTIYKRNDVLCVVRIFKILQKLVNSSKMAKAHGFVFSMQSGKTLVPLSANFLDSMFKKLVSRLLDVDANLYSIHSLRRSGATAFYEAGVGEALLCHLGRWRSIAYLLYVVIKQNSVKEAHAKLA
jgi:integrase